MAGYDRRQWRGSPTGQTYRDRQPCNYDAYLPDPLAGREFGLSGDVAADVATVEAALARLDASVRNMLRNPGYAGRTIFKRTKTRHRRDPVSGKRRRIVELRDESEWIEVPDATPPVVSEELFDAVQARLLDPERRRQAQRKHDYPLGGIVRCARCNGAMVARTPMGKYRYYLCRRAYAGPRHDRCPTRYVRAGDLERAVARELTTVLASPEVVLAELEHASSDDARDDDLTAAQQLLASLDNQRQRV